MIPIKYEVEASQVDYRPNGVTIRYLKKYDRWIVNIESDDQMVTEDGMVMHMPGSTLNKSRSMFKSPEEALTFWKGMRETLYGNYPEHGYNMGYYTDKEARDRRKEIGWDHIGNLIKKLNKADKKKNKKNKKD